MIFELTVSTPPLRGMLRLSSGKKTFFSRASLTSQMLDAKGQVQDQACDVAKFETYVDEE